MLPIVPPGPANFAVRVGKQRRGPAKAAEGGNVRLSERGLCCHVRSVAMGEPWDSLVTAESVYGHEPKGRFHLEGTLRGELRQG